MYIYPFGFMAVSYKCWGYVYEIWYANWS